MIRPYHRHICFTNYTLLLFQGWNLFLHECVPVCESVLLLSARFKNQGMSSSSTTMAPGISSAPALAFLWGTGARLIWGRWMIEVCALHGCVSPPPQAPPQRLISGVDDSHPLSQMCDGIAVSHAVSSAVRQNKQYRPHPRAPYSPFSLHVFISTMTNHDLCQCGRIWSVTQPPLNNSKHRWIFWVNWCRGAACSTLV